MTSIRAGDILFDSLGKPGLVTKVDRDANELTLERRGEKYDNARAKGLLNGLTKENRSEFNEAMAEIREHQKPRDRVHALNKKVEELRADPRKFQVVRYLEGELSHIMNTEKLNPREYKVNLDSIRE